ncbi:unnamed protein product [Caenorhabditis auriculariae]|uniref:C2H2-type domain-containing protein n=1 Tax=Caenorhabditis auriculariae TaxID=2777116 RepID=A0A8S1GZ88_9PELO|nr:unnamed protein product [Caenorhabditis auriculariae]
MTESDGQPSERKKKSRNRRRRPETTAEPVYEVLKNPNPSPYPKPQLSTVPPPNEKLRMANERQREEYYGPTNGHARRAPSAMGLTQEKFSSLLQYSLSDYPVAPCESIQIENTYNLAIKNIAKINAIHIVVTFQKPLLPFPNLMACALISARSKDKWIRAAITECFNQLDEARGNHKGRVGVHNSSLEYLQSNYITQSINPAESDQLYFCSLCEALLRTIESVREHLESNAHKDAEEILKERSKLISILKPPSGKQITAISQAFNDLLQYKINPKIVLADAVEIINWLENGVFPSVDMGSVKLTLFGSVLYECCDDDSDINISFNSEDVDLSKVAEKMELVLRKIEQEQNENSKISDASSTNFYQFKAIKFTYKGREVKLVWRAISPVCTSTLIHTYVSLRPAVALFLRSIRAWAKTLNLVNTEQYGMNLYGYDLICIHFLQKQNMLPYLHEMVGNEALEPVENESLHERKNRIRQIYAKDYDEISQKFDLNKEWLSGLLYLKFFEYFSMKHKNTAVQILYSEEKDPRSVNRKGLTVSDPFRVENVFCVLKNFMNYFFNCFFATFVYLAIPRDENGPSLSIAFYQKRKEFLDQKKKLKGSVSDEKVVEKPSFSHRFGQAKIQELENVQQPRRVPEPDGFQVLEEEEEYTKAADELAEEEDIGQLERELLEYLEFDGILLTDLTPSDVEIDEHFFLEKYSRKTFLRKERNIKAVREKIEKSPISFKLLKHSSPSWESVKDLSSYKNGFEKLEEHSQNFASEEDFSGISTSTAMVNSLFVPFQDLNLHEIPSCSNDPKIPEVPVKEAVEEDSRYCQEELHIRYNYNEKDAKRVFTEKRNFDYTFTNNSDLNGGYELEVRCTVCDSPHGRNACPYMKVPEISNVVTLRNEAEISWLDETIDNYYENFHISSYDVTKVEKAVEKLQLYLRNWQNDESIRLDVFGSFKNGFGVKGSDIDVCMRYGSDTPPEGKAAVDVIKKIAEALSQCAYVRHILPITTAKVPIVKFKLNIDRNFYIDTDISYYNVLALYNTQMLRRYCISSKDNRVAKLGLFVKKWAKECDIGDAAKGSLSSYSYIVLLIHYLQNLSPPVVPRLQEDYLDLSYEQRLVDNWDTYYHELDEMTGYASENKQSVGELFIGFLDYYSRYDYDNLVIQIRRRNPLTKIEKEWPRLLCIEDPFDFSHNLGGGILRKMWAFIQKTIICSRHTFMDAEVHRRFSQCTQEKYMSSLFRYCSQGQAPSERACRFCRRIGHYVENCPSKDAARRNHQPKKKFVQPRQQNGEDPSRSNWGRPRRYEKRVEPR